MSVLSFSGHNKATHGQERIGTNYGKLSRYGQCMFTLTLQKRKKTITKAAILEDAAVILITLKPKKTLPD